MLLTLTTTRPPATDLGFWLHKHPEKLQAFSLPFGHAHVFYPEANTERCTAVLLLDIDPVGLTRRAQRSDFALYPCQRPPLRRVIVLERRARPRVRERPERPLSGAT